MAPSTLVLFPFYALLGGIGLLLVLGWRMSSRSKGILAVVACLVAMGGVLAAALSIQNGRALELTVLSWDGPLELAYHVDGLSLLFALMATTIGAAVLLYSIDYMAQDPGSTRFYVLMLVFIGGLVHLVYTANLLIFYLSWEVIGLCSFLLVGFWYQQKEAVQGARKVLVMTHLAGYGLLAAILLIFARTGSLLWTDPRLAGSLTTGFFLIILVAAVAKSVQFPLHTWIPDAMAAPTPVSSLLHAACYVKAGVYLVARLHSLGAWPAAWGTIVIWIGTITMIVGVLYAMIQTDLKRMLAFHTVSQIGYMMLGLGLGTPLGIAAGLLHCLNHGFFKGGLFLGSGAVQHSTGTKDMNQLGGLARRMPRTALFWLVSAGAISGLPLMSGFVSKWLLYNAALETGQVIPALVAWVVSILTVFSFLKATSSVFLGAGTAQTSKAEEAPASMRWGMGLMAASSMILGVAPQLPIQFLINPVLPALGLSPVTQVTWFGMSTATGSWWSTGGLILAVVALGGGVLVYALAQPGRKFVPTGSGTTAWGGVFTGGEPLRGSGRLPASDFSAIIKHNLAPFYNWVDMDRYYLAIWHALLNVSRAAGRASAWMEQRALLLVLGLSLTAILLIVPLAPASGTAAAGNESVPLILTVVTGLAWLALVISASASPKARSKVLLMALSGGLAVGGLVLKTSGLRLVLLESAALLALLLVWQSSQNRAASRVYLAAVLVSAAAVIGGSLLLNAGKPGWAAALLFVGFALKLGLVPLYLWLPQIAEATPAPVAGLVVSVIDVAAFGELWLLKASDALPAITGLWLALAVLSALGGALLMLAQHDLKRLLAFSSIEDMGYLVLGVFAAGQLGLAGALTGVMVHALAKALLFASLVAPEAEGAVSFEQRGMAVRYPLAGAGFLVGMLTMLGVPLTWGFAARWRLYISAAEISPLLLFAFLLASALALLAYAQALTVFWWGTSNSTTREPPARSTALNAVLLALILALFAGGLWPELIPALSRLLGG